MSSIELSIVMPCLNEEQTIGTCIEKAISFLEKNNIPGEVIVGDNGSQDRSIEIAESLGAKVIREKKKGYGSALRAAIRASNGKYILMGDSDDSYNFSEVKGFIDKLRSGSRFVMGNRFKGTIAQGAMPWKNKYLGNPFLSWIGKLFFNVECNDFHCGMRAFRKDTFEKLNPVSNGMEFASEMVIKAKFCDIEIEEIPINLYKDGRDRPPHLRPWRDGWRHLTFMLVHSPKWAIFYPGIVAILLGLIAGAQILSQSLMAQKLGLNIGALFVFATFTILGVQAVIFSIISRHFGMLFGSFPPNTMLQALLNKHFRFELIFMLALSFASIGIASIGYCFHLWSQSNYGALDPIKLFNILIPSGTLVIVGAQLAFGSLCMELIQLSHRKQNT